MQVPAVLSSGHHANILKWEREQSLLETARKRPDLIEKAIADGKLSDKEKRWLSERAQPQEPFSENSIK